MRDLTRDLLQEAIDFCATHGLRFDFVNENCPKAIEQYDGRNPRKVAAHYYIDDRAGPGDPFASWYPLFLRERLAKLKPGSIIAVDFDGTLCRGKWPDIGEPNLPLIAALRKAQSRGYRLTLWTCREHNQ